MKVKPNPESKIRTEIRLLDQTSVIQLIMILLTLVVYAVFLSIQQFLFEFEDFRNKVIIINVLLCAGIGLEIGYFIWKIYKRKQKYKKVKNNS
ncbi:MAG: hypothetical protein KAS63_00380 [Candidatus Heimdallarchaeota archaeon]|nr:hypothetical protein [Candidatus Heimdallarchaeota archaeon]MCK4953799.1 hypothetical protein [Candidatus Heimdallarchaeota archaeon]